MPAPVPAGYTRGPIMFVGPTQSRLVESQLLQLFWQEAGGYGARILIVSTSDARQGSVASSTGLLADWESDTVANLNVKGRPQAMDPRHVQKVEAATGILLIGGHLRLAGVLGGTPLAQAIRRANARRKVVCGMGSSAAFLCQHMLASRSTCQEEHPFMHQDLILFAPGLGLINRIVLDGDEDPASTTQMHLARLLTAISYNPFLIGVNLGSDTGAVVYPDGTMEIFGAGSALVVDGERISYASTHEQTGRAGEGPRPISILNVNLHLLAPEHTIDLENRIANLPPATDIPKVTDNVKSAF